MIKIKIRYSAVIALFVVSFLLSIPGFSFARNELMAVDSLVKWANQTNRFTPSPEELQMEKMIAGYLITGQGISPVVFHQLITVVEGKGAGHRRTLGYVIASMADNLPAMKNTAEPSLKKEQDMFLDALQEELLENYAISAVLYQKRLEFMKSNRTDLSFPGDLSIDPARCGIRAGEYDRVFAEIQQNLPKASREGKTVLNHLLSRIPVTNMHFAGTTVSGEVVSISEPVGKRQFLNVALKDKDGRMIKFLVVPRETVFSGMTPTGLSTGMKIRVIINNFTAKLITVE